MTRYYIAGILATLASSLGQVCLKFSSRRLLQTSHRSMLGHASDFVRDSWFLAGVFLFTAAAATSVWAMTRMEFSVYYSLTALNYLFITILSRTVLGEPIDERKIIGNVTIIIGILVYSLG